MTRLTVRSSITVMRCPPCWVNPLILGLNLPRACLPASAAGPLLQRDPRHPPFPVDAAEFWLGRRGAATMNPE